MHIEYFSLNASENVLILTSRKQIGQKWPASQEAGNLQRPRTARPFCLRPSFCHHRTPISAFVLWIAGKKGMGRIYWTCGKATQRDSVGRFFVGQTQKNPPNSTDLKTQGVLSAHAQDVHSCNFGTPSIEFEGVPISVESNTSRAHFWPSIWIDGVETRLADFKWVSASCVSIEVYRAFFTLRSSSVKHT